jgi:flagellar hook-length control protein FliK
MQTPLLPLPTIGANAAAAPKVSLNAGGQEHQFQRALSREMEQRQSSMADSKPAARAPAHRPTGPSAPRQAAPAKPAQAASPQDDDTPVQPGARSAPAVTNGAPAAGKGQDGATDDSQSDAQAAMDGPVADMLALVAAFNRPPAPAAGVAGAAGAQAAVPADQTAAALAAEAGAALADGAAAVTADPALAKAAADQADTSDTFQATLAQAAGHADAKADAKLAAAGMADGAGTADAGQAGPDDGNAALGQFGATGAAAAAAGQHKAKVAADLAAVPAGGERTAPDNAIPIIKAQPAEASALLKAATTAEPAAAATAPIAPAAVAGLEIAKAAASVPADKLAARVGTPGWDQQLGQKIVFMAAGGEQSATMELNPPDLGPLQVVLSVSNDHATVAFSSAQPEVRQALEAAVPKLREMMSDAGIQLGNATVSAGMSNQDNGYHQQTASAQSGGGGGGGGGQGGPRFGRDSAEPAPRSAAPLRRLPAGAVDTFA